MARQLAQALAKEFPIDDKTVRIGVTTGISVFPHNGTDAASLLANAGAALFRAKVKSRGSIGVYEPEMDQQIRDRRVLHQDLSLAIKNGELSLHYQPQAASGQTVASSAVIGFEALARWLHPVRGFVPPADFIPLAEESGLIVEMGEWILREACREAASWSMPLQIAVNLSPAQFMHGDLVSLVHSILLETGLSPGRLELEITEGVLIEDFDRGLALLRRLKALGVRISMDDFGSGYSSLSYLQAFPFDKIKIDRAFVMNLGRNPQSAAIVRAVIGLGHGLECRSSPRAWKAETTRFPRGSGLERGAGLFHRASPRVGQWRAGPDAAAASDRARAQDRLVSAVTNQTLLGCYALTCLLCYHRATFDFFLAVHAVSAGCELHVFDACWCSDFRSSTMQPASRRAPSTFAQPSLKDGDTATFSIRRWSGIRLSR